MTKASIVQRLLDEKHITAEEAVILLQSESSIINIPQPQNPYAPIPWQQPYPLYPSTPYIYGSDSTKKY